MNRKKSTLMALAISLTASLTSATEVVWPMNSARDLSTFLLLQNYRIYADRCSDQVPKLQPQFANLMDSLSRRIQEISKGLFASGEFKGTKDKPVPAEIVFALDDMLDDSKHNFERQEAAFICSTTLQSLGEVNDESLKSRLSEIFSSVEKMTQNLEKGSAR